MSIQHIHDMRALLVKLEEELPSAEPTNMERNKEDRKGGVKEMADLKSAMEEMGETLRSVQAENAELKASLQRVNTEVESLKKDGEDLRSRAIVVEEVVNNMREGGKEVVEVKKEVAELKKEAAELKKKVEGDKESLRSSVQTSVLLVNSLEVLRGEAAVQLKKEVVELKKESEKMKGTLLETTGNGRDFDFPRPELGELSKQEIALLKQIRGGKENIVGFDDVGRTTEGEKRERITRLTYKHHPKALTAEEFWRMDRLKESELEDDNTTAIEERRFQSQPTKPPSSQKTLPGESVGKKAVWRKEIEPFDLDATSQSEEELSLPIENTQFTSSRNMNPAADSHIEKTTDIFPVNPSKQNKRRTSCRRGTAASMRDSRSKKAKIVDDVGFTPVENKGRAASVEL